MKACIKAHKVYDWVTRDVQVPLLNFRIDGTELTGDDPCLFLNGNQNLQVNCIPTDATGTPIDPLQPGNIICREVTDPQSRQDVPVPVNGDVVTLQKVKVLKQGFVKLDIQNQQCDVCTSNPIPYSVTETFLLCAPKGTTIDCVITDFDCDATIVCGDQGLQQVDIAIDLCQDIEMIADVKLAINENFCAPREEVYPVGDCPTPAVPESCPQIF